VGAFFVAWLFSGVLLADPCQLAERGELVASQFVLDGDTLQLTDGRRLRLIGLDTPEIGRRGEPSQPFSQAAKRRLQELAGASGLRLVVGTEGRDRYGRTLGHLFSADGYNLEARLLEEGLGFAIAVPPNTVLARCHLDAERRARSARLGLWGESPIKPVADLQAGGFQVLRGRIQSFNEAGGHLWLELDGPLVLRIGRDDREQFSAPTPAWLGREVEVRGWVIDRRGQRSLRPQHKPFMLPLRHPLMLEMK